MQLSPLWPSDLAVQWYEGHMQCCVALAEALWLTPPELSAVAS